MVDPRVYPPKANVESADVVRRFGPQYAWGIVGHRGHRGPSRASGSGHRGPGIGVRPISGIGVRPISGIGVRPIFGHRGQTDLEFFVE